MLAIDNSPSNPNTHHSHSSYPPQMEDFSTEVISLANSEMTIESRYQAAAAATTPSTPPQLQEQLQLQEQPPLTKISSQSKASTPSVSTSALKKASSLFKLNTNSQSRNKKHTNKQQQQSQPSPTSPKTLTNITSRQSTPTPTPTPSNSTSRPNLRSLLRIGSFSNNQPHIHSNNPHVKNPSITALEGEIEVKIDEEDIEEEDNIEEEDDEIAYLSDLESDLNYDPKAEESHEDYRTGGYHPVSKGEIYYSKKLPNREYIILRKLGWGHFSTVWLAKSRYNGNLSLEKEEEDDEEEEEVEESLLDLVDINEYYVAIKFVKSNKNYMEAARDEIKIMNVLNDPINNNHHIPKENISYFKNDNKLHPGYNHVMQLKDDFEISGPNGIHICMVFEILGENVLNLIYRYKRLYRSINSEIKRKESAEENICLQQQLQMKFSKWDTKNWKKSTKSMLSLGLHNKKDTHKHDSTSNNNNNDTNNNFTINHNNNTNTNGQASINTTAISTASSSSLNSNPHEDSFIESSGSGSNSVSGSGSGSGSGQDNESTTTVDSWEDDLDKKIKSLNSQSLIKLIETSKTVGGIPLYIVKQIVKQMLLAIDYMHHCGIIHTDLKPENILIDIKDINKLIRTIEDEKLSKFRANNNNNLSRSRKASLLSNCSRTRRRRSLSKQLNQHYQLQQQQQQQQKSNCCSSSCHIRTLSTTSNSSQSSYFYKKLKNSIVGKYESPIRCSKPLSSSISSDSIFKDVNFNGNDSNNHSNSKPRKKSISKAISPRNFSFFDYNKKDQEMIDDNIEEEEQQQRECEGNIRGGISIKIADLGNATFVDEHFTNQIQTRQYRSPEIILKYKHWGSLTDLWSIGCIIFELITGDFLFDPHDGKCFDKDEDHLAQIVELLGDFPNDEYLLDCKLTGKFFKLNPNPDLKGNLQIMFKNIDQLKIWKLKDVLIEKYKFNKNDYEVDLICDLILKCLKYDLNERYDANSLLKHPWFDSDNNSTISPGLEDRLKSLPNCHDDLPGYTCECKI